MAEFTGGSGPDQRPDYAKEAATEGREAFRRGLPLEANPKAPGTNTHWAWSVGWRCEKGDEEAREP